MHTKTHKPRPLADLLISIIIPSVILMKLSGDGALGATGGLVAALAFPLGWGIFELVKYKKKNWIAVLGVVSVVLTGGIGLLQLDPKWLAVKEAAVPGLIGIGVLISGFTRYPLVRTLLYNPLVLNVEKIQERLSAVAGQKAFEKHLARANYFLSGTFFFSACMNYILAKWIVVSDAGSSAFNEELGRLTLLSYPMIAIPSMIMMMGIFFYLYQSIRRLTGLSLEEIVRSGHFSEKK